MKPSSYPYHFPIHGLAFEYWFFLLDLGSTRYYFFHNECFIHLNGLEGDFNKLHVCPRDSSRGDNRGRGNGGISGSGRRVSN
ncbi:hypothetical protein DPMN_032169 [Dreissena polymorpha]|uniref:Uncharacterized protein n=1 Tax=Dreissena polymorpha TaxID=45954 RepID=A0A9D4M3R5_DREPO|nr:hypothetical protein DPMN_032169 [Dreissena polymorpha]